jgi:AcrR family transcriptional regulator
MTAQKTRTDAHRRLLDGLAQSIREKGLRQTQINDIVRNARVSKRTFYECFADKESCFVELIEEWTRTLIGVAQEALDPEAPWEEQVDVTVDAYLAAIDDDPALEVTITRELPAMGERGMATHEEDINRIARFLMETTQGPAMRRAGVEQISFDAAVMLIAGIAELLDRTTREGRAAGTAAPTIKMVIKRVIGPGG